MPPAERSKAMPFEIRLMPDLADELGAAEDHIPAGEEHTPAVAFDDLAFRQKPRRRAELIFAPLHIKVGLDVLQDLAGRWIGIDVDVVHELQRRQALRPEFLRDVGPHHPFADGGVARQADDQDVSLPLGKLQVADVAWVNDVETPMALHDDFAGRSGGLHLTNQVGQIKNLGAAMFQSGHPSISNPFSAGVLPPEGYRSLPEQT